MAYMKICVKEVVKKIISPNILRKVRAFLQRKKINKLGNMKIEPFNRVYPKGINLIGSFRHDTGLGQSSRLLAREIDEAGINYNIINFSSSSQISNSDYGYDSKFSEEFGYGINIWHVNMHEFTLAVDKFGINNLNGHKNIAFWLWEMEEFPREWVPLIRVLDEIWTPSEFVSESIRKVTQKSVITVPYAMEAPYDNSIDRAYFGLPSDKFLYLMMFDTNSISARKNPEAVLRAFKQAFSSQQDDVGLVIKINHLNDDIRIWIDEEMVGYHVYYVKEMLSKEKVNALIKNMDVYVSLHRAEGFGLVLAEAMLLGTPTIATNYSSNTEFQTRDTACLVDYIKVQIGKNIWPYKKNNIWAEPDTKQAAQYIRKLYENKDYYEMIRENASKYIREKLGINRIKKIIIDRIDRIYEDV